MTGLKNSPVVLSLDNDNPQPLSIRAKALVFCDPASRAILDYIEMIAPSEAPVLVSGETGTGKELVARHLHALSGRTGPFLAVNCGAISENLAESELFGHESGSFTGATGRRQGWFEAADGGTLFLDEIGDLPLSLQVKLLRVIQEREVVRVGSRKPIPVNVRLITGTYIDLEQSVAAGNFRQDLLYRINIAQVHLPALRDRQGDILPLAEYFIQVYSARMNREPPQLSVAAEHALLSFDWPGNIRELENVIHFALLVSSGKEIGPEHLRIAGGWGFERQKPVKAAVTPEGDEWQTLAHQVQRLLEKREPGLLEKLENLIINETWRYSGNNQVHTAALLDVSRNVARTLLKRHDLIPG
ncbi:MAG TPA: sigma-54 dependent transcriptional regulator [Pseudohongiella sp.]|nr:sigma-54 dependent transcriptional regulator [Pseudohongiella sp.]